MNKILPTLKEAVSDIPDGATICSGVRRGWYSQQPNSGTGFKGTRNITAISNNCGTGDSETGVLFKSKQIRRVIAFFLALDPTIFKSSSLQALWTSNSCPREFFASVCAPMPQAFTPFFQR